MKPGRSSWRPECRRWLFVGALSSPLKKSFGREPVPFLHQEYRVQSRLRQNSETTQVASVSTRTI